MAASTGSSAGNRGSQSAPEAAAGDAALQKNAAEALSRFRATIEREKQNHPDQKPEDIVQRELDKLDARQQALVKKEAARIIDYAHKSGRALAEGALERHIVLEWTNEQRAELRSQLPDTAAEAKKESWFKMPEMTPKTQAIVGSVVAVVGIVGLGLLIRKMLRKTDEKAKQATEVAGSAWTKVKWAIGLAFVGTGAYLGIRGFQKIKEGMEALAATQKKIEELQTAVAGEAGEAKDRMEQEIARLRERERELQAGKEVKPEDTETVRDDQSPLDAAPDAPPVGSLDFTAVALAKFFGNGKVGSVIGSFKNKSLELVLSCSSADGVIDRNKLEAIYQPPGMTTDLQEREEYMLAAEQLIGFIAQAESAKQSFTRTNAQGKAEPVLFGEYLRTIGGGYSLLHEGLEMVRQAGGDVAKWNPREALLRQMREGNLSIGGRVRDSFSDITTLDGALGDISITELLEYLNSEQGQGIAFQTVSSFLDTDRSDPKGHVLQELCRQALLLPGQMIPFFHEVLPNNEWDENNMSKNEAVIRGYLQEMPVEKALRFLLYIRMMKSKNHLEIASGVALMQIETLHFIRTEDETAWGYLKPDSYSSSGALLSKLGDPEELDAFVDQLNVPPEARDRIYSALLQIGGTTVRFGLGAVLGMAGEQMSAYLAAWENHPYYTAAGTVVGASVLTRGIKGTLLTPVDFALWNSQHSNFDIVGKSMGRARHWSQLGIGRSLWSKIESTAAYKIQQNAAQYAKSIVEKIRVLGDGNPLNAKLLNAMSAARGHPGEMLKIVADIDLELARTNLNPIDRQKLAEIRALIFDFATNPSLDEERYALQKFMRPFKERTKALLGLLHITNKPAQYVALTEDVVLRLGTLAHNDEFLKLIGRYKAAARADVISGAERCMNLGMDEDDIILLLKDRRSIVLLKTAGAECDTALKFIGTLPKGQRLLAMGRMTSYLSIFKGSFIPAELLDPAVLKHISNMTIDAKTFARLLGGRTVSAVLLGAPDVPTVIKQLQQMERLHLMRVRAMSGAFVGLEAIALGMDIIAYNEARKRIEDAKATLARELSSANGFTSYQQGGKTIYKHTSGVEVCAEEIERTLDAMSSPEAARIAIDSVGLAGSMASFIAPSMAFGPLGTLVAVGIVLTVHAGIEVYQQRQHIEALTTLPMPILVLLGTARVTGKSEDEEIAHKSAWLMSEVTGFTSEAEKAAVRRRAFLLIFGQELQALAAQHPQIMSDILGGKGVLDLFSESGEFINKDFPQIIAPFLSVRLYELCHDDGATWQAFKDLRTCEGTFDMPNVSERNIRRAMREATWLYVQHLRERRYRRTVAANAARAALSHEDAVIETTADLEAAAQVDGMRAEQQSLEQELGAQMVFGVPASTLPSLTQNGWTDVQYFINQAKQKLEEQSVSAPTRGSISADAFAVTLPEGILPRSQQRTLALWQVGVLSESAAPVENSQDRYNAFIARAQAIREALPPEGKTIYAVGDKPEWHLAVEYGNLLNQFPEMDPDMSVRQKLFDVEGKYGTTFYYVRDTLIPWHVQLCRDKRYSFEVVDPEQLHHKVVPIPPSGSLPDFAPDSEGGRWWQRVNHLEWQNPHPNEWASVFIDGKEYKSVPAETVGQPVDTPYTIPGKGNLTCRSTCTFQGGAKRVQYEWFFLPTNPGPVYIMHKNYLGIEQPGKWFDARPEKDISLPPAPEQDWFVLHWTDLRSNVVTLEQVDGSVITLPSFANFSAARAELGKYFDVADMEATNMRGRELFNDNIYRYESRLIAFRLRVRDNSPITKVRIQNEAIDNRVIDLAGMKRLEDKPEEPLVSYNIPATMKEEILLLTGNQNVISYPWNAMEVTLTLKDGRVVKGDYTQGIDSPLHDYLDIHPTKADMPASANPNRWRGDPDSPEYQGWDLVFRNKASIQKIELRSKRKESPYPHVVLYPDVSTPETAIEFLQLTKLSDGSSQYMKEGHTGNFTVEKDGSVRWTGGTADDGKEHGPMVWRKGVWRPLLKARLQEANNLVRIPVKAGTSVSLIDYSGDALTQMIPVSKEEQNKVTDFPLTQELNDSLRIGVSGRYVAAIVTDPASGAEVEYAIE